MDAQFSVTPDLYASKGSRFTNYIIDLLLFIGLFYGVIILISVLVYTFVDDVTGFENFVDGLEHVNPFLDRLVTGSMLALLYFFSEWLLKGRTIGKYITKTKVVMLDGSNPEPIDFLKRSFSRIIPFEALSFLGAGGRGWHDTLSKTFVVDIERFHAKQDALSALDDIGKDMDVL
ncbi:RDD family protein [Tamlana fucoidanivorans]|uniref:RDD family protein n=1 Tax=Allotamlana fucoidanivorans TaxID=2583814 RepID=A0A5C4SND9_9FLAO|nr:RDD family protein [Tamlana fucoidanivorans]TNJ45308.1 RDD family protein [Tamlana fucoidanivorans]